ncbi:Ubiquitin-protein ligase E3A [Tritrichomonas musculus]|uniref:HECT-type E3 ubiquitin transferase n=1 Tax=Tritrichomonas musculus TaxID=1915356 RepID=A0ABR2KFL8_9EUKA
MSYTVEDLLPLYYSQLCHGCNGLNCHTKECRSCSEFKYKDNKKADIDLLCTQLAFDYENNKKTLCPNLSPILLHPKYSLRLIQFNDFAQKFIHDQPVDNCIKDFNVAFLKNDIFSHIFLTNDGFLKPEDLHINADLCSEFHEALKRRSDLIQQFVPSFVQLIQSFEKVPNPDTLHWIRGILILSVFSPMLQFFTKENNHVFSKLFEKITYMSVPAFQVFYNAIVCNPIFIRYLNEVVQNVLTSYINDQVPDPHTVQMHTASTIIELLSEANSICENPINPSEFVNASFNKRILPEFEYKLYKKELFSYLKTPSILDVSFKSLLLRQYSRQMDQKSIVIRRDSIVEDGINKVLKLDSEDLQKHIKIEFENENAQDSGGVSREFFFLLFNKFFSAESNLFVENETGGIFWFNKKRPHADEFTDYKYVGIIVGLSLSNSIILPVRFPLVLYKKLYDVQLTFHDFEELYPETAQSLNQLRETFNGVKDDQEADDLGLELYFTTTDDVTHREVPIVPDGLNKKVTKSNLEEFINAKINFELNENVKQEFQQFKEGFKMSMPQILNSFKYFDLDVLVSGTQVLNWSALKTNTTYANGFTANSPSVVMFWKIFDSLDDKQKGLLLQFITGCARAPAGGLEAVNIVIQRSGDVSKLPTSHTCFNTFVLPDYENELKMKEALQICSSNAEGFGLI